MPNDIRNLPGDGIDTSGVVTIFCCGTASGETFKDKYAVPYLYDRCSSDRKAILNGPGGGPIKIKTNRLYRLMGLHRTGITANTKKYQVIRKGLGMLNQVRGLGTRDNVKNAIGWLKAEKTAGFHTINLVGWSRGAVTCTMLAHQIQEVWEELGAPKVHIFAFDPVAGGNSSGDPTGFWNQFAPRGNADPKKLPACVKAYHAILHENLVGKIGLPKDSTFVCTIPARADVPNQNANCRDYRLYPLPGNHEDSCLVPGAADLRRKSMATLGMRLAVGFLSSYGTLFDMISDIQGTRMLELYADIWMKYGPDIDAGPTPYRRRYVQNDYRNHAFYINHHHEKCVFAESFPLWMYIDKLSNPGGLSPVELQEAARFMRRIDARFPKTADIVGAMMDLPLVINRAA